MFIGRKKGHRQYGLELKTVSHQKDQGFKIYHQWYGRLEYAKKKRNRA
jgi:hypothetical protein